MQLNDWLGVAFLIPILFLWAQVSAAGSIGVRRYSAWYETHFLFKKEGLCRLIYFKPKHFGRFTFFEVFAFFFSFFQIAVGGVIALLGGLGILSPLLVTFIPFSFLCGFVLFDLVVVILNDIGAHRDEKKIFYLGEGEREVKQRTPAEIDGLPQIGKMAKKLIKLDQRQTANPYFTVYNLKRSYEVRLRQCKNDPAMREKLQQQYIDYFRNMDNLVVLKENKDDTLVLAWKDESKAPTAK